MVFVALLDMSLVGFLLVGGPVATLQAHSVTCLKVTFIFSAPKLQDTHVCKPCAYLKLNPSVEVEL